MSPPSSTFFCRFVYRREPALYCECCNLCSVRTERQGLAHGKGLRRPAPWLRLEMRSRNPWGFGRLGIEASLRVAQRRSRSLLTLAHTPRTRLKLAKTATRESLGTISLRSSSRFPLNSGRRVANPVMFPPGRARLATKPLPTGSLSSDHDNGNCSGCLPWLRVFLSDRP